LIEKYLFAPKIAYFMFVPVFLDITLIPIKPFDLKKDIHPPTSIMYIINIYNSASLVNPLIFLISQPMLDAFVSLTPAPLNEEKTKPSLWEDDRREGSHLHGLLPK
jgi:hypothetical protein